jgi:hypothetical protein
VKFAGADDPKFIKLTGEVLTPDAYAAYESAHPAKKSKKGSNGTSSK